MSSTSTTYHTCVEDGDHAPSEDVLKFEDGLFISECYQCGKRIYCSDIDLEYFKDTSEVVFCDWEVAHDQF